MPNKKVKNKNLINAGLYELVDNVLLRVSENYKASEQKHMLQLIKSAL